MQFMGTQSWYYANIYALAETGRPRLDSGCFAALVTNFMHERKLAANTKGDVKCRGYAYKYRGSDL